MQDFDVDGLHFSFPDNWHVGRYDDWGFYRNRFSKMWNGIKSLDLLAIDPDRTAWLVEVKDYRVHQRTKPSDLADEVARKVFDTLAAMLPAKIAAQDQAEKQIARAVVRATRLRVVLHLEQPLKPSKLYRRAIDPANVKLKLRQLLKPVDAHPFVVETNRMMGLAWTVAEESPEMLICRANLAALRRPEPIGLAAGVV